MTQQVRFPKTTTTVSPALVNVANEEQRILVVSQKIAAGTAVAGDLNADIGENADTLAGKKSFGAEMVRAVRRVNKDSAVDAIFLDDDGSGVPAVGAVDFTGSTATEAGELTVVIGSARNHALSVAIASGDNATAIGATLVAAIVADDSILVNSVNTVGDVAITATNDGTAGNEIPIQVLGSVAGVTVALTAMVTGATDPSFTTVFDVITDIRYQTIIWNWAADVAPLTTLVDTRFNSTGQILDGLGYVAKADTLSNHTTTIGLLNSFINYTAEKLETGSAQKGAASAEWPPTIACYAGGLRARKLTVGAAIANLNVGQSGSDGVGGPALASRPLANTPIFVMNVFAKGVGWTKTDTTALNAVGGSIIGNNDPGNQIILGEQFTTRLTFGGNPNDSFKFVNFFDTSVNIREFYDNNLRERYGQIRLSDGDLVSGRPMTNVRQFESALDEFYKILAGPDFALARDGETNLAFFKANRIVTINLQTGVITWSALTPIVTQVREIDGNIQIVFAISDGTIGEGEEEENPEDPEV